MVHVIWFLCHDLLYCSLFWMNKYIFSGCNKIPSDPWGFFGREVKQKLQVAQTKLQIFFSFLKGWIVKQSPENVRRNPSLAWPGRAGGRWRWPALVGNSQTGSVQTDDCTDCTLWPLSAVCCTVTVCTTVTVVTVLYILHMFHWWSMITDVSIFYTVYTVQSVERQENNCIFPVPAWTKLAWPGTR